MKITPLLAALTLAANLLAQPSKKAAHEGDDQRGYTDTPLIPGQKWKVHDAARPHPRNVTPGRPLPGAPAPSDAEVLFDGKDLSHWMMRSRAGEMAEPKWKVENGYVEIVSPKGMRWNLITKEVNGRGQADGNSGIELMSRYEIQVLESLVNATYADGQAASLYGQWPPLVNASPQKGEWNAYDIFFEAPKFEGDKLVQPGYVTVMHNGVLVHHHREILGPAAHRRNGVYQPHAAEEPLSLQDHGHPTRYRNIWIRRLKAEDAQ